LRRKSNQRLRRHSKRILILMTMIFSKARLSIRKQVARHSKRFGILRSLTHWKYLANLCKLIWLLLEKQSKTEREQSPVSRYLKPRSLIEKFNLKNMLIYSVSYILTVSAFLVVSGLILWNGCERKIGNLLAGASFILASVGLMLVLIFN